jgi:hypothetical protein
MATNLLRGRPADGQAAAEPTSIAQDEQEIFDCPRCSRPLAEGVRRCPGCGLRLVAGIPLSRAGSFVIVGLIVGLAVGGGAIAGVNALTASHGTGGKGGSAAAGGSTSKAGGGNPAANGPPPSISALMGSVVEQAGGVNVRLAEAANDLRVELNRSRFDTAATAAILRTIASNASFGAALSSRISEWPPGDEFAADLSAFYGSVRETARTGLAFSITNPGAYRQAGRDMLRVLDRLDVLDREARKVALSVGIDLPALPRH